MVPTAPNSQIRNLTIAHTLSPSDVKADDRPSGYKWFLCRLQI